jgi:thiamine biosynthesis protein ThiS
MIEIHCNGEVRQVPAESTVADLLASLGLAGKPVAVEVNLELVPRDDHESRVLQPRDRIEVVTLVGGG